MAQPKPQHIVFERLNWGSMSRAIIYRLLGRPLHTLYISPSVSTSKIGTALSSWLDVNIIALDHMGHYSYEAHTWAVKNTEKVYKVVVASHPLIQQMKKFYKSETIELAFKRRLAYRLAHFYTIQWEAGEVEKKLGANPFLFIPTRKEWPYTMIGSDYYGQVLKWLEAAGVDTHLVSTMQLPKTTFLWEAFCRVRDRIQNAILATVYTAWFLYKSIVGKKAPTPHQRYKYGAVVLSPIRQFANEVQHIGFIVDNEYIHSEDFLVISSKALDENQKNFLKKKGLPWFDDLKKKILKSVALASFRQSFSISIKFLLSDPIYIQTALGLIFNYCKWASFTRYIRLENFITVYDLDYRNVSRNLLLEKTQTETWFYVDSSNLHSYQIPSKSKEEQALHQGYSFLKFDHLVSWSKEIADFYQAHLSEINQTHVVGCLWSEHLMQLKNGAGNQTGVAEKIKKARQLGQKVVAVFDSTMNDDSRTKFEDGLGFLKGIKMILEENEDILVAIKEKKPRRNHPLFAQFHSYLEFFENHPRCLVLSYKENPSDVMANSDLVISFPFTSTSFEALAARQKAIFYDSTGRFDSTFYSQIPGVICRGPLELQERVRELLFHTSEEQWNNFVENNVKGTLEPYCDGQALTRFRELLSKVKKQQKVFAVNS